MKSIGLRCWANKFAYVVLEGSTINPTLVGHDIRTAPGISNAHKRSLNTGIDGKT